MEIAWPQIWGIIAIGVGIYWIINRDVPVGIEGSPPSFHARGKWAVLLGIVAIIIGLIVALEIPKQIKIDKCLDNGGKYDYENNKCDYGEAYKPSN
jgi:hypothetical protein